MRKTLEKSLLPLKSTIMDFEIHYKKYAPLKSLLHYTTITCQNFSFALFLYLEIFWSARRHFLPVTMAEGYHFEFFMTFLKLSIYIISIWTQVIDLWVLSKLWGYSPLSKPGRKLIHQFPIRPTYNSLNLNVTHCSLRCAIVANIISTNFSIVRAKCLEIQFK